MSVQVDTDNYKLPFQALLKIIVCTICVGSQKVDYENRILPKTYTEKEICTPNGFGRGTNGLEDLRNSFPNLSKTNLNC